MVGPKGERGRPVGRDYFDRDIINPSKKKIKFHHFNAEFNLLCFRVILVLKVQSDGLVQRFIIHHHCVWFSKVLFCFYLINMFYYVLFTGRGWSQR